MVVWLVVPPEAADSALTAGGVVAVVAAAAAASTVLSYWVGMEDDIAGDLEVLSRGGASSASCLRT